MPERIINANHDIDYLNVPATNLTIASGVTLTIPSGSVLEIV